MGIGSCTPPACLLMTLAYSSTRIQGLFVMTFAGFQKDECQVLLGRSGSCFRALVMLLNLCLTPIVAILRILLRSESLILKLQQHSAQRSLVCTLGNLEISPPFRRCQVGVRSKRQCIPHESDAGIVTLIRLLPDCRFPCRWHNSGPAL